MLKDSLVVLTHVVDDNPKIVNHIHFKNIFTQKTFSNA